METIDGTGIEISRISVLAAKRAKEAILGGCRTEGVEAKK
jgi:hypothetical protein